MNALRTRWAAIGAAVAVALGGGGLMSVSATSPDDAVTFVPITPCRVMDTRPELQVGPRSSPLGAGDTHTVDAVSDGDEAGDCAGVIPAAATAVSMNVTAVDATAGTFLTIWEAGLARPTASSLNPAPGQPPTPNAVTTNLDGDGRFSIYNLAGTVHVLADIDGYYTDHHHDDRYYTKQQVDEQFVAMPDGLSDQPRILEYHPEAGSDWTLAGGGWRHGNTAGSSECLFAPVELRAGTTATGVTINYRSIGATSVAVLLASQRTTVGPGTSAASQRRHVVELGVNPPSSGGEIASITVVDDPGDPFLGLEASPLPGEGWETIAAVCTSSVMDVLAIRVDTT